MKQAKRTILFTTIFILTLFSVQVFAQEESINDPLKKPEIWEKITYDYQNISLWEEYFESSWDDLDIDVQQQIMKWQNILAIEMIAREEAIFDFVDNDEVDWELPEDNLSASVSNDFQEEQFRVEIIKYNQEIENIILQQNSELFYLQKNVAENFAIIEDILFEEFISFGEDYAYYDEVHPERKYSLDKWVSDKTKELQSLKNIALGSFKLEVSSNSTY